MIRTNMQAVRIAALIYAKLEALQLETMINLQRFAEGGGEGGGGEGAAPAAEAQTQGEQKGQAPKVLYGKQAGEQAQEPAQNAQQAQAEDLEAEWNELIKGKFKDQFTKSTQGIINKRFAQTKGLEESNQKYRAIMETVAARYGADPNDLDGLKSTIDNDKKFLMEQADKAGMTVDQYRQMQQLRAENERFRAQQRAEQERIQVQEKVNAWRQEAEQVKQFYPQFDMDTEFQNSQFVELVKARIPMKQAYEAVHHEELMRGFGQYAAQAAQQQTIQNIQARGMRPQEGAAKSNPAAIVKNDVKKLSRNDREEIARRVMRGEKITFA